MRRPLWPDFVPFLTFGLVCLGREEIRPESQELMGSGSSPLVQWGQAPTLDWAGLAVVQRPLAQIVQSWG